LPTDRWSRSDRSVRRMWSMGSRRVRCTGRSSISEPKIPSRDLSSA
jgi:hypothetical protein